MKGEQPGSPRVKGMPKPLAAAGLALVALTAFVQSQTAARSFPLTVDSIMRGPDLVGYPPDNTRWSGDSQRLYFEWRQPKDDVAATWVVNRAGGAPRRLTENERRSAPLPAGQWDATRRRQLGVDNGDIVVIDTTENRRIDITRTTAAESSPRWARSETAVTFVRDNNLFLVPLDGTGGLVQLTDVAQKRPDSKMTDSQRSLRREEVHILDWVEQERARRERREARGPNGRSPVRPSFRASSASRRTPKTFSLAPKSATRRIDDVWRSSTWGTGRRCGPGSKASWTPKRFPGRRWGTPRTRRRRRPRPPRNRRAKSDGHRCCCRAMATRRWRASVRTTTPIGGWSASIRQAARPSNTSFALPLLVYWLSVLLVHRQLFRAGGPAGVRRRRADGGKGSDPLSTPQINAVQRRRSTTTSCRCWQSTRPG